MRIHLPKFGVEKQEINENDSTSVSIKSNVFRREWNSTTSVSIVQVVLVALLLGLSQSMRIELDNRKEKDDK